MAVPILLLLHFCFGGILALIAVPALTAMTGDRALSVNLTVMIWFLLTPMTVGYGQFLPGFDAGLRTPRGSRAEGKLRSVPFRFAFVYGMFSSACLARIGLPDKWLWPIVAALIGVGYFLGRDFKWRVQELRKRYLVSSNA